VIVPRQILKVLRLASERRVLFEKHRIQSSAEMMPISKLIFDAFLSHSKNSCVTRQCPFTITIRFQQSALISEDT